MNAVDNMERCLSLLRLAIQPSWHPSVMRPDFLGSAKNWKKFNESEFQAFAKECGIKPGTIISIWNEGNDLYRVAIAARGLDCANCQTFDRSRKDCNVCLTKDSQPERRQEVIWQSK